ncbi:MAG: pyrophosphatase PpaX [Defluviitaleaceae bacterium]|nr:pyrophosphatase PpaX [Defluviitaleaceae bacterium]
MIKAILFDFDGTLADTNPLIIRTFTETFAAILPHLKVTQDEILTCIGPTLEQTGEKYLPENPDQFVSYYRMLNVKYHDDMIDIYPGIQEMLAVLQEKGLTLVIVSSKKRDFVIRGLKKLALFHFFDAIVAGDDVTNPKPHSEPIDQVLAHYGLLPTECLMVGDNSHDIECARAAGVKSIAVGWAVKGVDYLKQFNPDYLINDAMEIVEIIEKND